VTGSGSVYHQQFQPFPYSNASLRSFAQLKMTPPSSNKNEESSATNSIRSAIPPTPLVDKTAATSKTVPAISSSSTNASTPPKVSSAAFDLDDEDEVKVSKQQMIVNGVKTLAVTVKGWVMNPKQTWHSIKEEAHHYWMGTKLLWSEIQMTTQILERVVQGHELTRREKNQLIRTSSDLFRLIPFAIIVVIPFMELLLPVLLKVFPNMLPSTFEV
jgi:hypothetical protein